MGRHEKMSVQIEFCVSDPMRTGEIEAEVWGDGPLFAREKHGGDMPDKTVRLDVGIWYDQKSRYIKISAKGAFISTVSNDPESKRYHPNLYKKLAKCLHDAGAPGPRLGATRA